MCFSPEVDLVTGVAITAIGVDALRHVEHPSERALASLPVILGAHQIIEAVVWWGVDGRVTSATADRAAWLYLAVAFGVLPVLVPWAIRRTEPDPARRRLMGGLALLGAVVALRLMAAVVAGPIEVADGGHYLTYHVPLTFGGALVVGYIVATCGPLLASSDRRAVGFGVINLVAAISLALLLSNGVISLWCVWAAVTSGVIALHLRRTDAHGHRVHPAGAVS
jgi:hypothetical protein